MTEQRLTKILDSDDVKKCLRFFKGMPEPERRALAPFCIKRFQGIEKILQPDPNTYVVNPQFSIMRVTMPSVCTLSELKKLGHWGVPDNDTMFAILQDRRPDWIDAWVKQNLEQSRYWHSWPLIYRLLRADLCAKPDHPNYVMGMISGLIKKNGKKEVDLRKALLADPDLLQNDVWKLFESDGSTQNSLAMCDRWKGPSSWGLTLIKLSDSGKLSRTRLIDCTFDALQRDFNHYRAKWFQRFHDALKLTLAEQEARRDRYISLLRCSAPPVASWSYSHLEKLHRQSPYDVKTLASGLEPILQSRQKGIVKRSLTLLGKSAKESPESSPIVAETALIALAHENADIQKAALELIVACGDPADENLRSAVKDHVGLVSATIRMRLLDWANSESQSSPKKKKKSSKTSNNTSKRKPLANPKSLQKLDPQYLRLAGATQLTEAFDRDKPDIPAATFHGMDIPRLDEATRLQPITQVSDLVELCSRVIEDGSQTDDIERVLDGVTRLCNERPDGFDVLIGPLKKRVVAILKRSAPPFSGYNPVADVCSVIYAWITSNVVSGKQKGDTLFYDFGPRTQRYISPNPNSPLTLLGNRSRKIAARAATGKSHPLLSTPTHTGAWISPMTLVDRVNNWQGSDPDEEDVYVAILRLAPDGRDAAIKELKASKKEWSRAIKYTLGGKRIKPGTAEPLWMTAARAADPWADDANVAKAFSNHEPDEAIAATYETDLKMRKYSYRKTATPELVIRFHPQANKKRAMPASTILKFKLGRLDPNAIRWAATLWPQARESYFFAGANALAWNLDWHEAEWENKEFLWPLHDPDTPLRQMGLLMLSVALAAKEPGEHGLATDIAIAAIEDGRLGTDNFGPMLSSLLPTGLIMSGRIAKSLGEVARASQLHAFVVQRSLQAALRKVPQETPKDIQKSLELLNELSVELGLAIDDPECQEYLGQFTGSGKAAKLSKELLTLEDRQPESITNAQRIAFEHRLQRVRRWSQ